MSRGYRRLIVIASVCGLIQSALWICSGLACCLIYLCVIPIAPYKDDSDFFRVTFVKLYFEGPQCIPDGSYLGEFNKNYRKIFDVLTPDKVWGVMITYIILNAIYFILSILLFTNKKGEKRAVTIGWSGLTLTLCAIDALFETGVIRDILNFRNYMKGSEKLDVYTSSARGILNEITYIPLVLALILSRFIVFWIWNFIVGIVLFLDELCCRKITGKPSKPDIKLRNKRDETLEEFRQQTEDHATSVSVRNGKYYNAFDTSSNLNGINFDKSMESVTSFRASKNFDSPTEHKNENKTPNPYYWSSESHSSKQFQMTNEGYVNDECDSFARMPEKKLDPENLKSNEESNSNRESSIGKQVSIPVTLPLPINESYNC